MFPMKRTILILLVSLFASQQGYAQALRSRPARQPDQFTGHYVLRYSNVRGRLDVQRLPNNRIKFSLTALLVTSGGETRNGVAEGTVPLKGGTAIYRNGECRITMKFLNNRVEVKESNVDDCGFGAFVTAQGTYIRRSRKPGFDP
jgi:hypothetical protein